MPGAGFFASVVYLEPADLGTVVILLILSAVIIGISVALGLALHAKLLLGVGRWRFGLFITDTTLLLRMEVGECYVVPRALISSVHIFHKVRVSELLTTSTHARYP